MSLPERMHCPDCHYAITWTQYMALPAGIPCPRCGINNTSHFYAPGSKTHEDVLRAWDKGVRHAKAILPPALPTQA